MVTAAAAAKSLQSCPTLCDPIDGSPPGSPIPGILQARTLEWVATSFSNAWKWKVKVKSLSRVQLLATPWTAAYQAPPSMGFSRQELLGQANNVNKLEAKMLRLHINQKAHSSVPQRNLLLFFFFKYSAPSDYILFSYFWQRQKYLSSWLHYKKTIIQTQWSRSTDRCLQYCQPVRDCQNSAPSTAACATHCGWWLLCRNTGPVMPDIPIFQEKPNI